MILMLPKLLLFSSSDFNLNLKLFCRLVELSPEVGVVPAHLFAKNCKNFSPVSVVDRLIDGTDQLLEIG